MSELEARSLSSRNTLGDQLTTQTKLGYIGLAEVYGGKAYAEVMVVVVVDEEATILSSLYTLGDSNHSSSNH